MTDQPSRAQISSGGVLFAKSVNGIQVALIRRITPDGKQTWCLPKGWVETGETLEMTAIREVKEETGLEGNIIKKLGKISYWFKDRLEAMKIHKTVHFYLLEYLKGDTSQHDNEVEEARWFNPDEAAEVLTYPNERKIFHKALQNFPNENI